VVLESIAASELRKALLAFTEQGPPSNEAHLMSLRRCLSEVVDERKAAGDLPEHVVVLVKHIALEAGVPWTNQSFFERLIDWTLERYWAAQR
jgi:hypothetical protein